MMESQLLPGGLVALDRTFDKLDGVLYKPKISLSKRKFTNETEGYVVTLLRFPEPDIRLGSSVALNCN